MLVRKHFIKYRKKIDFRALIFYVIMTFLFNWSLLCGKNVMKWDIMDAYYPLCMSSADMLPAGKLPLWNAALKFGTPTYVMLGIPYWYPTTILFEIITGYSLECVALEYCIHITIACYGMYLLTKLHLKPFDVENSQTVIAIISGVFYGFSGLFFSNAEHIMIIVSATWLPWVLYFVKKYFDTGTKIFLMAATISMGLSILGGYPEVWVSTFIILIPYFVLHINISEKNSINKLFKAAVTYIIFFVQTLAVAAVSLIPFLMTSKYIDRLGSKSQVSSYTMRMALSAVFPHYTSLAGELKAGIDVSMISMFMGLLTLMAIALLPFFRIKYKWSYVGMGCFTFLMMLGRNAFLHPLFYRYFPMFSTFRFPSTWRCILAVFILLLSAEVIEKILQDNKAIAIVSLLFAGASGVFLVSWRLLAFLVESVSLDIINGFQKDCKMNAGVCLIYAAVFMVILYLKKKTQKVNAAGLLIISVLIDIFAGQMSLQPVTVTARNQWEFETIVNDEGINSLFQRDRNRTHSIEYSNAERTRSGLDSTSVILNHTLDEQGYLSVVLNYVETYSASEHCRLSAELPVAYITNDVVSEAEVDYTEWIQDTEVSPWQIYVEHNEVELDKSKPIQQAAIAEQFISGHIMFQLEQETSGFLVVQQSYYPGWYAYVDGKKEDIIKINGTFLGVFLNEGNHKVEFVFKPWDFYVGAAISAAYLGIFAVVLFRLLRKKRIWYDKENKA